MRITKLREMIATLFCIILVIALAVGAATALGIRIPVISGLLGK